MSLLTSPTSYKDEPSAPRLIPASPLLKPSIYEAVEPTQSAPVFQKEPFQQLETYYNILFSVHERLKQLQADNRHYFCLLLGCAGRFKGRFASLFTPWKASGDTSTYEMQTPAPLSCGG